MFQKLFAAVLFIVIGLLCLNPIMKTKLTYLSCNRKMQCEVYSYNILKGGQKSIEKTFEFKTKNVLAECDSWKDHSHNGYPLRIREIRGGGRYILHYFKDQNVCREKAKALNSNLRFDRVRRENFNLSDNFMMEILFAVLGIFMLVLGVLCPFIAKTESELTPEEKAKIPDINNMMQEKIQNSLGADTVNNIQHAANKVEDFTNHPLVKFLRMFIR